MTHRDNFAAALLGKPVDRPPIYLREGFDFIDGPANADHPVLGWQAEPTYRELWEFAQEHCVMTTGWSPGGHFNRYLAIPPSSIRNESTQESDGSVVTTTYIDTPEGQLTAVGKRLPGVNTGWRLKPLAETRQELEKLLAIPFEVEPVNMKPYRAAVEKAGDCAVPWTGVSSPFVVVSGCMRLADLLVLATTERQFFHELLAEITRRWLAIIEVVLKDGPLDTMVTMGGSEQCTPPMMHPDDFDELIVPYDGRIVAALKGNVLGVNCHCHGKVRRALEGMLKMGFDATDPVEPPPAGDLSIAEAREIAGDRMTLVGNFEFDELESAEPDAIRRRVREIMEVGPNRLVLAASAGPISRVTEKLAANYRAWIEAALETA